MFFHNWRNASLSTSLIREIIMGMPVLFDESLYLSLYPEVSLSGVQAIEHFATVGVFRNFQPHLLLDPVFYRNQYGQFLKPQDSVYLHYLTRGWRRGWKPHPLFDPLFYVRKHKEVSQGKYKEPLRHYLEEGWRLGYATHPLFDPSFYLEQYPDIVAAGLEPLQHYLRRGAAESRKPCLQFDPVVYTRDHIDEGVDLAHAAIHFAINDPKGVARLNRKLERLNIAGETQAVDVWAEAHGGKVIRFESPRVVTWPEPHIINRMSSSATITGELPKQYVTRISNAKVIPGTRVVITSDSDLLHDELTADSQRVYHPKLQIIRRFDDVSRLPYVFEAPGERLKNAVYLSSDTDWNYFHWMVETLPKLSLVEKAGVPPSIPLLIRSGLHPNQLTAMKRLLGKRPYIEREPNIAISVAQLWYVSDMSRVVDNVSSMVCPEYDIVISRDAVRWMHDRLAIMPQRRHRRIYVERASNYRLLLNELKLIAALEAVGFERINTTRLTLDQQITLFAECSHIVSPTGAAMTNLMFCHPGVRALILVAENTQSNLNIFNHVGQAVGVDVSYCLGQRAFVRNDIHTVHDDFFIDIEAVLKWCEVASLEIAEHA